MRRIFSWIVILGILGLMGRWLAVATAPAELKASTREPTTQLTLVGPYMRDIGVDGLRMAVTAETATFSQHDEAAQASGIHAEVYRESGTSVITSDEADYKAATETAHLTGNVQVRSQQGYTLDTTSAVYHHATQRITAAGFFEATGKGVRLEGYGLDYDLQADHFVVERDVGATILGVQP